MSPLPLRRVEDAPGDWTSLGLAASLEEGQVVVFKSGIVPTPSDDDMRFLREELAVHATNRLAQKNISYHPVKKYLSGLDAPGDVKTRTKRILEEHHGAVRAFLDAALPPYARGFSPQKSNFRPIEEKGRPLSVRASNERVHIDAYASGPTHGDRVLRFFTNIHPTAPRVWRTAGPFQRLLPEFAPRAGVPLDGSAVKHTAGDRTRNAFVRALEAVGVAQAGLIGSSGYDRAMRKLHNTIKEDDAFQSAHERMTELRFEPFESWMVFTDGVSHAAVSGQHALVHTFHVALGCSVRPQLAPYHVLATPLSVVTAQG